GIAERGARPRRTADNSYDARHGQPGDARRLRGEIPDLASQAMARGIAAHRARRVARATRVPKDRAPRRTMGVLSGWRARRRVLLFARPAAGVDRARRGARVAGRAGEGWGRSSARQKRADAEIKSRSEKRP